MNKKKESELLKEFLNYIRKSKYRKQGEYLSSTKISDRIEDKAEKVFKRIKNV